MTLTNSRRTPPRPTLPLGYWLLWVVLASGLNAQAQTLPSPHDFPSTGSLRPFIYQESTRTFPERFVQFKIPRVIGSVKSTTASLSFAWVAENEPLNRRSRIRNPMFRFADPGEYTTRTVSLKVAEFDTTTSPVTFVNSGVADRKIMVRPLGTQRGLRSLEDTKIPSEQWDSITSMTIQPGENSIRDAIASIPESVRLDESKPKVLYLAPGAHTETFPPTQVYANNLHIIGAKQFNGDMINDDLWFPEDHDLTRGKASGVKGYITFRGNNVVTYDIIKQPKSYTSSSPDMKTRLSFQGNNSGEVGNVNDMCGDKTTQFGSKVTTGSVEGGLYVVRDDDGGIGINEGQGFEPKPGIRFRNNNFRGSSGFTSGEGTSTFESAGATGWDTSNWLTLGGVAVETESGDVDMGGCRAYVTHPQWISRLEGVTDSGITYLDAGPTRTTPEAIASSILVGESRESAQTLGSLLGYSPTTTTGLESVAYTNIPMESSDAIAVRNIGGVDVDLTGYLVPANITRHPEYIVEYLLGLCSFTSEQESQADTSTDGVIDVVDYIMTLGR